MASTRSVLAVQVTWTDPASLTKVRVVDLGAGLVVAGAGGGLAVVGRTGGAVLGVALGTVRLGEADGDGDGVRVGEVDGSEVIGMTSPPGTIAGLLKALPGPTLLPTRLTTIQVTPEMSATARSQVSAAATRALVIPAILARGPGRPTGVA